MRANSDRSRRFAFDRVAGHHDRGRQRFSDVAVDLLVERARLLPTDRIVEIGAGTGQLTIPLAERGFSITALEPGERMAAELRRHVGTIRRADVTVFSEPFEQFVAVDRYDVVVAANSFHWIDPEVSYHRTADVLADGGRLALLWSFPVLADADVQRQLNEQVLTDALVDLQRDPDGQLRDADASLADGRREMGASGRFDAPTWLMVDDVEQWSLSRYASFLSSLAATTDHAELIGRRLAGASLPDPLTIVNHTYICVAQRL